METCSRCIVLPDRAGPWGRPLYDPPEDAHAEHPREPSAAGLLEGRPNQLQGAKDRPISSLQRRGALSSHNRYGIIAMIPLRSPAPLGLAYGNH